METTETVESPDLTQSIEAAVAEQNAPEPVVEKPVETPAVETEAEPADIKAEEPKAEIDPKTAQALQIYEALMNPSTAQSAIEFLAKQSGYQLQPVQAAPKVEPGIKELIAQELGSDYEFLAPRLGTAIENVINKALAPIQEQIQQTKITNEFDRAMADLNSETKGEFGKMEADVVKVMQRMRPAEGVSTKEFLRDAYTLAKAGKAPSPAQHQKAVVERLNKTAQEALPSPAAATETVRVSDQQTLESAITEAAKALGMV
jgi:hypothetical protein